MVSASPNHVSTAGGDEVTFIIDNFPIISGGGVDAQLVLNGINVSIPVLSAVQQGTSRAQVTVVAPGTPRGTDSIHGSIVSTGGAKSVVRVAFTLLYVDLEPVVQTVSPSSASTDAAVAGLTLVNLLVVHFTPVSNLGALSLGLVDEGSDTGAAFVENGAWSIDAIVFSDDAGTLLQVIPSGAASSGTYVVELRNAEAEFGATVRFTFVYYPPPPPVTILRPLATCGSVGSAYAVLPHCATWVVVEPGSGLVDLEVEAFPSAIAATTDLVAVVGDAAAAVETAEYDPTTATLRVSVRPEVVDDILWSAGGDALVTATVSLKADMDQYVGFHVVLLRQVQAVSAEFDYGYGHVVVTFNQPVSTSGDGGDVSCSKYIGASSLLQLGHSPEPTVGESSLCFWISDTQLGIFFTPFLGQDDVASPGVTILELNGGVLLDDGNHAGTTMLAQTVAIRGDTVHHPPTATAIGATVIGSCEPLALNGDGSKGVLLEYKWGCLNNADLDKVLQAQSGSRIDLNSSLLPRVDFTYRVALYVVDFIGTQSPRTVVDVYRSGLPLPTVVIDQLPRTTAVAGKDVRLDGAAQFSACADGAEQLFFSWEVSKTGLDGMSMEISEERLQSNGATIIAGNLLATASYTFTLRGFPLSAPENEGSSSVSVEILRPPLRVAMMGGSRDASALTPLSLACDILGDDMDDAYDFEWICASDLVGGSCRDANTNALVVFPNAPSVVVPPSTLPEARYSFSVRASDKVVATDPDASVRYATSEEVSVAVMDVYLPELSTNLDPNVTPISESGLLNVNDKLAIMGVIQPLHKTLTNLTLQWTSTMSGLDFTDKQIAPLGSSTTDFVLNPGYLTRGSVTTFTLTASAINTLQEEVVSASASTTVQMNIPPISGTCRLEPDSVNALQTKFDIVCSGWKDATSIDIYYQYQALLPSGGVNDATSDVTGTKELALLPRSKRKAELRGITMPLPEDGGLGYNATIVVLVSDDEGSESRVELPLQVFDAFAQLSADEQGAVLESAYADGVVVALQRGDSLTALSSVSTVSDAQNQLLINRRRRLGSSTSRRLASGVAAKELLQALKAATQSTILDASTLEMVIQALSSVTVLRDEFNTTDITEIFTLSEEFSEKSNAAGRMTEVTGSRFVQALGNILNPDYLSFAMANDFAEAGNATAANATAAKVFTTNLSLMFEDTKNNIAAALLARSVNGEPPVVMVSDGVGLSAQKLGTAEAASQALGGFGGAFQLPGNIGSEIDSSGGVQIMVGISKVVWAGAVNGSATNATAAIGGAENVTVLSSNTTIGDAVHSLTLGKGKGGGAYEVNNLAEPVIIELELSQEHIERRLAHAQRRLESEEADEGNTTFITTAETQCLYWDPEAAGWSDEGCTLVSENATHAICACTHLTDFATAFVETAFSADFSSIGNLDVFNIANFLENPSPLVMIFMMYFFGTVGVVMGSNLDAKAFSKPGAKKTPKTLSQFKRFKEVGTKPSFKTRACRALFLTSNICLMLMAFIIIALGVASPDSALSWLFGDLGKLWCVMYGCFQFLMCFVGLLITGMLSSNSSLRALLLIWIVLGFGVMIFNCIGLFLSVFSESQRSRDRAHDLVSIFWDSTETDNRVLLLDFTNSTDCPDPTDAEEVESDVTKECSEAIFDNFEGYLLLFGSLHMWLLLVFLPAGYSSALQWVKWRKKSSHATPVGVEKLKGENEKSLENFKKQARTIVPINDGGEKGADDDAKEGEETKDDDDDDTESGPPFKSLSFKEKVVFVAKLVWNGIVNGWGEVLEGHRLFSLYFRSDINFPRADRVLCLMAYLMAQLFGVGLFQNSAVIQPDENGEVALVYTVSHSLLVVLFATTPVVIVVLLFENGNKMLVKGDSKGIEVRSKLLSLRIQQLMLLEGDLADTAGLRDEDGDGGAQEKQNFRDVLEHFAVILLSFQESESGTFAVCYLRHLFFPSFSPFTVFNFLKVKPYFSPFSVPF
jgi:hypothetical protein